jgi:hypothetical protein
LFDDEHLSQFCFNLFHTRPFHRVFVEALVHELNKRKRHVLGNLETVLRGRGGGGGIAFFLIILMIAGKRRDIDKKPFV